MTFYGFGLFVSNKLLCGLQNHRIHSYHRKKTSFTFRLTEKVKTKSKKNMSRGVSTYHHSYIRIIVYQHSVNKTRTFALSFEYSKTNDKTKNPDYRWEFSIFAFFFCFSWRFYVTTIAMLLFCERTQICINWNSFRYSASVQFSKSYEKQLQVKSKHLLQWILLEEKKEPKLIIFQDVEQYFGKHF